MFSFQDGYFRVIVMMLLAGCAADGSSAGDATPANHPPTVVFVAASPAAQLLPGDTVDLTVRVSDPDGDTVRITWSAAEGVFSDPSSLTPSFLVPDHLGPLELSLQLEDDQEGRSTFSYTVVIGYQLEIDGDGDGVTWDGGDCNDLDPTIMPDGAELVDGKDNDCDGFVDEDSYVADDDGDRWSELAGDCDDADPTNYPTNPEKIDGRDNDCDGYVDEGTSVSDDDGDGYPEAAGDCNDARIDVWPGAEEIADGLDNDCDLKVDEGTLLGDDDEDGLTEVEGDCDDERPDVRPGLPELTDGVDNDCDGRIDEGSPGVDDDGDGLSENAGDCLDEDETVFPGALEVADGIDNDCDLQVDEGTILGDDDGDGLSEVAGDCDDAAATVSPLELEVADGIDNDCDGWVDEGTPAFDVDGDGVSEANGDCDPFDPTTWPGAPEAADGLDNDCDGTIDEGTVRADDDQDGFSELEGDCNDDDDQIHPGAFEDPTDALDNDCDGLGAPNEAPTAVVQVSNPGEICLEVVLDASGSFDPDGDPLRHYYWFVTAAPAGSLATDAWLEGGNSSSASFVADLPGTYGIGLIVSDGISSSALQEVAFSVEDRVDNTDPIAEAGPDQARAQQVMCSWNGSSWSCPPCETWTATLDGAGSVDPDGDRLFFAWVVSSSTAPAFSLSGDMTRTPALTLEPPPAEYGRTNSYALILKLEVEDCLGERDVDTTLVTYTCTGK